MPTTGSEVSPNSVVEASLIPARFRAPSMQAICMPRQMPKKGISRSRAKLTEAILPSLPRSPKPPGTRIPCSGSSSATTSAFGMLEQLGVDPLDVDLGAVGDAAVDQRLAQALVGVGQADIFADDADRHLAVVMVDPVHDVGPARELGPRRVLDPEGAQHFVVEAGLVILQRHVVDVARVERRDDRRLRDVAEQGDLLALAVGQRPVAAAQQHFGLDPEAGELAHRLLGRLGLELAGRRDPRHQGRVDADRIVAAEVVPQLADRFDERQAFDVADRAADLADDEIDAVGIGEREFLDRVGDVRDDLDGRAEIIAAPLLGDDVAVDAAGRDIVGLLAPKRR